MSQQAHLTELMHKHRKLDTSIRAEMSRPAHDEFKIAQLKRQKLKLKEQITALSERLQ